MSRFVSLIASALVLSAALALHAAGKPNVIVVLSDDQGFGDFSSHGNPVLKTPNFTSRRCVRRRAGSC
jgi:hypothetical protein